MSRKMPIVCFVCMVTIVLTAGLAFAQSGVQYAIVTSGTGSVVGQLAGNGAVVAMDAAGQNLLTGPGVAAAPNSPPVINAMFSGPTAPNNTVLAANLSCSGGCASVTFQYCQRAQNCNFVNFGTGVPDPNNASLYKATMTAIPKAVYYWLVIATDKAGRTTNSRTASAGNVGLFVVADPPSAPTGVTASTSQPVQGPVPGGIYVAWPAVTGAATYSVKTSTSANGPFTVAQSPVNGYFATVTTLTPNTTYYVVVSALNGGGESPNSSNPVSVLTPPAVPANVGMFPSGPNSLGLIWSPSPGAASYSLSLGGATVTATAAAANCPTGVGMCTYGAGGFPAGLQTSCSVAAVNSAGGQSAYTGAVYCNTLP